MAIRDKSEKPKISPIEIDLTGPQGNAFALLGSAQNIAKQMKYSKQELKELDEDMTSGDYEHLLEVFDKHFGKIVTLWR